MERIRLGSSSSALCLRRAVSVLKDGGVIAYPTETVYGLGCDPRKMAAIERIRRIKKRARGKPFLFVAASLAQVKKVARLDGLAAQLAAQYWPGPLVLVLPSLSSSEEIAIRVSSSEFVRALTNAFRFPIISTSANHSDELEARSGMAVANIFQHQKDQPDLIIDAGALPRRKTSTIARITKDGEIEICRQGSIRLFP